MKTFNSFRRFCVTLLAVTGMTLLSGQAIAAQIFSFTFAGATASGSGTLSAVDNGNGSFTAISGSGTETVNGVSDAFTLIFNPNGTHPANSASGVISFDNQLFPGSDRLVDLKGLLFQTSLLEMALYSDAANSYLYGRQDRFIESTVFTLTAESVSAVPEPTSALLLAAGLIGFVASRRKSQKQ